MNWYHTVSSDLSQLPNAIVYFESELTDAKQDARLVGNIEKATAAMPGIIEHRFNQLQEIEAILQYLNIELKKVKGKHFRKYFESYAKALTSREVEKYVEHEQEVVDYELLVNDFALLRNKWLGIVKGLDQKSFALSNVIRLRVAGMEDASIV